MKVIFLSPIIFYLQYLLHPSKSTYPHTSKFLILQMPQILLCHIPPHMSNPHQLAPSLPLNLLHQFLPMRTNLPMCPPTSQITHVVTAASPTIPSTHAMQTWSKNQIHKWLTFTDGTILYPPPKALLTLLDTQANKPTSFTIANKSEHWRAAMHSKFNALLQNGTWTLVP